MNKLKKLIKDPDKANQKLKESSSLKPTQINKDATIQRFEFTFELAWKTIQEYVKDEGFDCKSPRSCIREGARLEIINNPKKWFTFLEHRNLISHTYNEKTANKVYTQAIKFSKEADSLLDKISFSE